MKLAYLLILLPYFVGCFEASDGSPNPVEAPRNTLEIPRTKDDKSKTNVSPDKTKLDADSSPVENRTPVQIPLHIQENILLPKDHQFSPDDELNLHGKRINKAQELIRAFFDNAVKAGKEFVLLITGKGLHSKEKVILDDGSEMGPIKYHFLLWMKEGIFSNYVQDLSYAQGVHGGEGAFYVRLKKLKANQ